VRNGKIILLMLACALAAAPGVAGEWDEKSWEEVPDWAATLGLFVFGGPAAAPVQIRLNDQVVAEVASGGQGQIYEILQALRSGPNEFVVEFLPGDAPPDDRARLSVSLATSEARADGNRRLQEAIAESALPAEPPEAACTETFSFWAGPPPPQEGKLKKQYFLTVQGPPVGYLVTIRINEQSIYTTVMGQRFFEITAFLRPGKNVVTFDAIPSCFPEEITASGKLVIVLAPGRMTETGIQWERAGQLLGQFDLESRKNPQPISRRQSFRAR